MKYLFLVMAVLLVAPNISFAGEEEQQGAPLLQEKASKQEAPKQAQVSTEMEDAWGGDDKIKTAMMELAPAGVEAGIAKSLTGVVAKEIDKMGAFKVIGLEDIKMLIERGWSFSKSLPVDMFPQTFHIESLTLLARH